MSRSEFALAALASAALPNRDIVEVVPLAEREDAEVALVSGDGDARWVVEVPKPGHPGQSRVLKLLEGVELPVQVPRVAGTADADGDLALVYPLLPGRPLQGRDFKTPGFANQVGALLASIHTSGITGVPNRSPGEDRQQRLETLASGLRSGRVPENLAMRWEEALEDVRLWRYRPTFIHGGLDADALLVDKTGPVAVQNWAAARMGDPAVDFAWIFSESGSSAADAVAEAYALEPIQEQDHYLLERARFASEFAVLEWFVRVRNDGDSALEAEAAALLEALSVQVAQSPALVATARARRSPVGEGANDRPTVELPPLN